MYIQKCTFLKAKKRNLATLELTKEDCLEMARTKRCDSKNAMKCQGDYCTYTDSPKIDYEWMVEKVYEWFSCEMYAVPIESENKESRILSIHHTLSSCHVTDNYCKLKDSIIVWTNEVIKACPYSLVEAVLLENFGGILTSDKENKLFQITEQKTICQNITVYYTSEGFYLTTDQKSLTLTKNMKLK